MQSPTSLPSPIKTRWIRATIVLASQGCRECGGWTRLERGPRGGDAVGECHVRGRARVSTDGPASNWAPSIPATWLPDESSVVGADGTTRGRLPVPRQSAVARDGRPRVEHLPIPAIVATRRIRATIILAPRSDGAGAGAGWIGAKCGPRGWGAFGGVTCQGAGVRLDSWSFLGWSVLGGAVRSVALSGACRTERGRFTRAGIPYT